MANPEKSEVRSENARNGERSPSGGTGEIKRVYAKMRAVAMREEWKQGQSESVWWCLTRTEAMSAEEATIEMVESATAETR